MDHLTPNIKAEIYYLSTDEGGRRSPCYNGYRPQFHITEVKMSTSASHDFIGQSHAAPGELVIAKLTLLSIHVFKDFIHEGKAFELREGPKTIARGKVMKILSTEPHF